MLSLIVASPKVPRCPDEQGWWGKEGWLWKEAVGRTQKILWTFSGMLRHDRNWIWTWQRGVLPRLLQCELRAGTWAQQQVNTSLFFRWNVLARFPQSVTKLGLDKMVLSTLQYSPCAPGWLLSYRSWDYSWLQLYAWDAVFSGTSLRDVK